MKSEKTIENTTVKTIRTLMAVALGLSGALPVLSAPLPAPDAAAAQTGGASLFASLQQAANCDRKCLESVMGRYLQSLEAHDPARLPLAKQVRFTENTIEMSLGDGLWQTAGPVQPERLVIADPMTAQVVFYGGVMENGGLSLLNVRLKLLAGQITEIETAVVRKFVGNFGNFDKMVAPVNAWTESLPPAQRRSRQELIALTNQYFEGIEQSSGSIVPFDPTCVRWENNLKTAPPPTADNEQSSSSGTGKLTTKDIMRGLTTSQTFDTHLFSYITHITDRRFIAVDEERGIVYAQVMFQHPGNVRIVDVPGRGKVELTGLTSANPNSTQILEAFRLKDGKITDIYAFVNLMPYHTKPGW